MADINNNELYKCSPELEDKGYIYTTDGLYCPLVNNKYLEISRTNKKYSYSLVEYDDSTFNHISPNYSCKEPITEDKKSRTEAINKYWAEIDNGDINPILTTISTTLNNEINFTQITEDFDRYEEQKEKNTNKSVDIYTGKYKTDGYALKDGIYWKIDYTNGDISYEYKVLRAEIGDFYRISDYSYQTSNYFEFKLYKPTNNKNQMKTYKFYGKKDDIIDQMMKNELAWNELNLKEFIYKFTFENSDDNTKEGVVGGYCSWNDIKKPSNNDDITSLTDYFKNQLTSKHLEVIKSLLLIPFHYILRNDQKYMSREIVQFVVICGTPSAFKTGIVNIVRNMFDFYNTIPIDAGGTPSSYASLRNAINDNIGFLMCDESNGVFLDNNKKFTNNNKAPVENLLKGIFQTNIPNVSSQTTGQNLTQHYNATPIFTWNDDFKKTEALKDRCICIEFKEPFHKKGKNLFNINEQKDNLLAFGHAFAYCFKKHWKELKEERNWEELVNRILGYMQEEYNIDTQFLINTKVTEKETNIDIEEMFFNRMHYKFRQIPNLESYIEGKKINPTIFDKLDVNFIKQYNSKSIYCYKTQFINYIRDKVAEDGGLTEKHIEKVFNAESKYANGTLCYRFGIQDFMNKVNKFNKKDDETEEEYAINMFFTHFM